MKPSGLVGSNSVRVAPEPSTGKGLSPAESASIGSDSTSSDDCEIVGLKQFIRGGKAN